MNKRKMLDWAQQVLDPQPAAAVINQLISVTHGSRMIGYFDLLQSAVFVTLNAQTNEYWSRMPPAIVFISYSMLVL